MRVAVLRPVLVLLLGSAALLAAQQPAPASGPTKQMKPADLKAWKTIRSSVLSNDGKWFVYVLAPNEGDANVIIRSTGTDTKEFKFPIGARRAVAAVAADEVARRPTRRRPALDQRGLAVGCVHGVPARGERSRRARRAGRGGRGGGGAGGAAADGTAQTPATQNKLALVNLATGEKKEFDQVRRFAFNGDKPTWVAMQGRRKLRLLRRGNAAAMPREARWSAGGSAHGRPRRRHGSAALQPRQRRRGERRQRRRVRL